MNKERYNQIIDDAYKNFKNNFPMKKSNPPKDYINSKGQLLTKEEFINKIKTDDEFSEKWGLKIEERELSNKERITLAGFDYENRGGIGWNMIKETVDEDNAIPRKLITVTYNNETIKFYDNNL
jgi:hypothetical protein